MNRVIELKFWKAFPNVNRLSLQATRILKTTAGSGSPEAIRVFHNPFSPQLWIRGSAAAPVIHPMKPIQIQPVMIMAKERIINGLCRYKTFQIVRATSREWG